MSDRYTKGAIGGLIGGIVMDIVNYLLYRLHYSNLRYLDWAALILNAQKPTNLWETVFSEIGHLVFTMMLGIMFVFVVREVTNKNIWFKGWSFGVTIWFISNASTTLFKVPGLTIIPFKTGISNFITASIFGLALAYILYRLEKEVTSGNIEHKRPFTKYRTAPRPARKIFKKRNS